MKNWLRSLSIIGVSACCLLGSVAVFAGAPATQTVRGIPLKPDPPPSVDGQLGEWRRTPGAFQLNRPEQVTFGKDKWTSPADLSATVWLAWREKYLYLAAEVTDGRFYQTASGKEMYLGDHIELFLDLTPDADPERKGMAEGQFQIGFSPGNFRRTGDIFADLRPEAFVYIPSMRCADDVQVAASRTERGYALEAAIPWSLLGVRKAEVGMPLSLEVAISDTDSTEPAQDTMITYLTSPWRCARDRMTRCALASPDSLAPAASGQIKPGTIKPTSKSGPTAGPLPVIEPRSKFSVGYSVRLKPNGDIGIVRGRERFLLESKFSTPEPSWRKGSNRYFKFNRRIEKQPEAIIVRDTFVNLTDENLPIMQRHILRVSGLKRVWLSGFLTTSGRYIGSDPENPTTFGATVKSGIGLLPLDDVFLVHSGSFVDGERLGLADNNFVLKPKSRHTSEWAIVMADQPDYFALVNAARRLRNVNFRIDGSWAFLGFTPDWSGKMSDQQVADFIRFKSAKSLTNTGIWPPYKGMDGIASTIFPSLDHSYTKDQLARMRRIAPGVKQLCYFHCYLEQLDERWPLYQDCRTMRSDGVQADYANPQWKLFFPKQNNTFGRDMAKCVDAMLNDIGYDGIYWDEMEYSAYPYHYGEPWDGLSADIDAQTMKVVRHKTSVTLLSQPYRLALAKKIMARGPLVANGSPRTRSMMNLHFPRFTETGLISYCTKAQLYTPIALGNHILEKDDLDSYRWMLQALDYGCVYYWYHPAIRPTHIHLTEYMFPITPMELHKGYIIGKERIVTKKSGLYGWGDKSEHEVHVFDDAGKEVPGFKSPTITRNGKTYTELRIADGWSAAIIRRANTKGAQ